MHMSVEHNSLCKACSRKIEVLRKLPALTDKKGFEGTHPCLDMQPEPSSVLWLAPQVTVYERAMYTPSAPQAATLSKPSNQICEQNPEVSRREATLVLHGTRGSSMVLALSPDTALAAQLDAGEACAAVSAGTCY